MDVVWLGIAASLFGVALLGIDWLSKLQREEE